MENLMFKISRIMSFVSFLCITVSYYLLFFVKSNFSIGDLISVLFLSFICIIPLLIFNWIFFKKITFWIQLNEEN